MKKLIISTIFYIFTLLIAWYAGKQPKEHTSQQQLQEQEKRQEHVQEQEEHKQEQDVIEEVKQEQPKEQQEQQVQRQRRGQKYGVFLGINGDEFSKLSQYDIVVIEPSEFSAKQVEKLHASGKTVYGYLNIGSIEKYRPYYGRFKKVTLDVYEDWPDERWVNVASSEWQNFIINELGKQYADMGFDGLFLDNIDVYYQYPREDIFQGLRTILQGLRKYNLELIINGGDTFVSKCMDKGIAQSLFDGVNQETVFTSIDFDDESYGVQEKEETDYFKEYLSRIKNYGLSVYLLEYGADQNLSNKINAYCLENGFIWYNAKDLELR